MRNLNVWLLCYANDNDAFVPERWANESLAILQENTVMTNLVHRDFSAEVAQYGDVVNTRRPQEFTLKRKGMDDDVVAQDAKAVNVRVPLNQHLYETFIIKDAEASMSFKDLAAVYIVPAAQRIATGLDRILLGQAQKFQVNAAGRLGEMTESNARDWMLEARQKLNDNKAYQAGRNLVLSSHAETEMLKTDLFIAANQRGDGGMALEEARLGRILGFDTFMDQNTPYVPLVNADTITLNHTAGAAAGDTGNKAVTSSTEVTNGEFVWFTGEGQPHVISAHTGSGATTGITLVNPYKYAVATDAVGYSFKAAAVKGAYASGYCKEISIDGITANKLPVVGQLIAFGTGSSRHTYTIVEATTVSTTEVKVLLDIPLTKSLADNDAAFPGPHGSWCFAFHRNALALVTRPLILPRAETGVSSAIANLDGVGIRVTMQYNAEKQGTFTTIDLLCGTAVLDANLGCTLYA